MHARLSTVLAWSRFIKDLTLEYNKMRQAAITTELLEIATAQMALEG
jgi:F-type H+-transporting ATPase subunit gamma